MTETLQKTLNKWVDGHCQDLRVEHPLTYTQEQIKEFKEYFCKNLKKFDLYRFITKADNIVKKKVGDTIKYNFISTTKSDIINNRNKEWNYTICGVDYDKIVLFKNCYGLDLSDFVKVNQPHYSYQNEVIFFGECKIVEKNKQIIVVEQTDFDIQTLFEIFKIKQDIWWSKVNAKKNDMKEYKETMSF